MKMCLRCQKDTARIVAKAPDGSNAWKVFYCERCGYSWRSTEEEKILDINKRDPKFQLTLEDLTELPLACKIPPLKR